MMIAVIFLPQKWVYKYSWKVVTILSEKNQYI